MRHLCILCLLGYAGLRLGLAQPQPGDAFRDYVWLPSMAQNESGKFLRVGGRLDYKINPGHIPADRHQDGYLLLGHYLDLDEALKAEVVLERIASHEDTRGLRIAFNGHPALLVPDPPGIPAPASDYMYHTYPVVPVPLDQLRTGWDNAFRLDVDSTQRWNWPQNLIYGVTLRIYYPPERAQARTLLQGPQAGDALGDTVILGIADPNLSIREVAYLGWYEGINYEGDGQYRQWHYHPFRGEITHHLGSTRTYPYGLRWDTGWLPDQDQPLRLAAWITDHTGITYFSPAIDSLSLARPYRVALCAPYDQPANWVTRAGAFAEKVQVPVAPDRIQAARLYWVSWSPCYGHSVSVNEQPVWTAEGPCYEYMAHEVPFDPALLRQGENRIGTGKEPLHNGQMVHGMEVQWPGIMLLLRYE